MYIKIHKSYRPVVAVCDSEILGKKFEEGIKILDVRESFYNGQEVSEEEALEILQDQNKEDATFNIVGDKSVELALKANIIDTEAIGKIGGVAFALKLL